MHALLLDTLRMLHSPCVTLLWEPQDIGISSGTLGLIRALGGAIAQALHVSIPGNELARKMPDYRFSVIYHRKTLL